LSESSPVSWNFAVWRSRVTAAFFAARFFVVFFLVIGVLLVVKF
jgi:hypothetical protein